MGKRNDKIKPIIYRLTTERDRLKRELEADAINISNGGYNSLIGKKIKPLSDTKIKAMKKQIKELNFEISQWRLKMN